MPRRTKLWTFRRAGRRAPIASPVNPSERSSVVLALLFLIVGEHERTVKTAADAKRNSLSVLDHRSDSVRLWENEDRASSSIAAIGQPRWRLRTLTTEPRNACEG